MQDKDNRRSLALLLGVLLSVPAVAAPLNDDAAVQLLQRLNDMEKEVSTLRGDNEQLRNDLDTLRKKQSEGFEQVDEKMGKLKDESDKGSSSTSTAVSSSATDTSKSSTDLNAATKSSSSPDTSADKTSTDKLNAADPNSFYSYGTGKLDDKNPPKAADSKPDDSKPASTDSSKADTEKSATTDNKSEADKSTTADSSKKTDDKALPAREERAIYDDAFNTLLKSPKDAIPAFRNFLKDYPTSPLASSAQYWIGEALYAEKDFKGASDEFLVVLKDYKSSDKAPGAALKLGYSFYELKEWDKARKTLEDVISFFPDDADTVKKARDRLDLMKSEGH